MKKKIQLIIHPGLGKTGTTYLQENIFLTSDYEILSKPNKIKDSYLMQLQYKIFVPKYAFNPTYPFNISHNLKIYSNEIIKFIDRSKKYKFILSDECLFDRNNYLGHLNVYLLKEVIENISDVYEIDLKFILSIRKQSDLIISLYGYDNYRLKKSFENFSNFISEIKNNPNLLDIYDFNFLIEKIRKNFTKELLILPLEELDENPDMYHQKIEDFLKMKLNYKNFKKRNVNSKIIEGNKFFNIRTLDSRAIFLQFLVKLHFAFKKYKFYEKHYKRLNFLKFIIFPKTKISKYKIKLSKEIEEEIKNIYKNLNQKLDETHRLNLKKYDYY